MKKTPPQVYYPEYLKLDRLLSSQSPKSEEVGKPAHDEMLFIVVHQVYELWFKQILHELDSVAKIFAKPFVVEKEMGTAITRLHRITKIQELLVQQLSVLETMTPLDFLDFRDLLIPASGFQSLQFRFLESRLGLRSDHFMDRLSPEDRKVAEEQQRKPSISELVEKWLERTPFLELKDFRFLEEYRAAVETMLAKDRATIENNANLSKDFKAKQLQMFEHTRRNFDALFDQGKHDALVCDGRRKFSYRATLAALFIHLYREEPILHPPFRFLTLLVDIDDLLSSWRHGHAQMVHRMIGTKIGTGGTSAYIRDSVDGPRIFGDLAELSTYLIPRSALPKLPESVERQLGFIYGGER